MATGHSSPHLSWLLDTPARTCRGYRTLRHATAAATCRGYSGTPRLRPLVVGTPARHGCGHLSWVLDTPDPLVVGSGHPSPTRRGYWTRRPHLSLEIGTTRATCRGKKARQVGPWPRGRHYERAMARDHRRRRRTAPAPAPQLPRTGHPTGTCHGNWTPRADLSWLLDIPAPPVVGNRHDKTHLTWQKDTTSRRPSVDKSTRAHPPTNRRPSVDKSTRAHPPTNRRPSVDKSPPRARPADEHEPAHRSPPSHPPTSRRRPAPAHKLTAAQPPADQSPPPGARPQTHRGAAPADQSPPGLRPVGDLACL